MIFKALEKETEQLIWEKYLVVLPHMEKELTFNEYKDKHFKASNQSVKTDEEIIADSEKILRMNKKS